jgi:hypothetical protein
MFVFISLLITSFVALSGTFVTRSLSESSISARHVGSQQVLHLAEAGLDQAILLLRQAPLGTASPPQVSYTALGAGEFDAAVTGPTIFAGNRFRYRIQATGYVPNRNTSALGFQQRAVEAYVELTGPSRFPVAAFADQTIAVSGNGFIDSYNSANGPYDPGTAGSNGNVGTNSIASGSVSLSGNAEVTGSVTAASTATALPPVSVPGGIPNGGTLSVSGNTTVNLPGGTYWFTSLSVSGNGRLNFTGPATVYLTGSVSVSGNGIGTAINLPPNLLLYVAGNAGVSFSGNANFYGGIYAPESSISISGNGSFFGAVVGRTIANSGNGNVHYDEALQSVSSSGANQAAILSWRQL